ncbi:MAG: RNase adapter RapZ [Dictyoglomus turgidum]|nr:MAG: RNase adapter RapZ [Dictyoglomus turgidum]
MDFQVFIITGLSGAGKSQSLRILEDLGFFCVDNIPPKLVPTLIDLCLATNGKISGLAVIIDIRTENFLESFKEMVEIIKSRNIPYKILFLEAKDEVIVKRYNETRRIHPLLKEGGTILESIRLEKEKLWEIRNLATDIVNTSDFSIKELKEVILKIVTSLNTTVKPNFLITITSFGFKYGVPIDAHLVFDVRFLPNPFYDPKLRPFSGKSEEVRGFVLSKKEARDFIEHIKKLLDFLIPLYEEEGRTVLNIAIGCTGGRHRAVVIADEIFFYLAPKYNTHLLHRDIEKDVHILK